MLTELNHWLTAAWQGLFDRTRPEPASPQGNVHFPDLETYSGFNHEDCALTTEQALPTTKQAPTTKKVRFWTALRHLLRFQIKLALDAIRDVVMSPISVICFLLDVVLRPDEADSFHRQMMLFGRKTDRRINLFGGHRREQKPAQPSEQNHS
ncbi:MAG: hypothetical protein Q7V56_13660 [Gammaproteobacteria bacterium]|nr:hypothetical protein [Gammaproteobacteria bacterium]